jgi:oligoendopeptidase F
LISKLSIYHDGFDNIFSTLTDSDIKYEDAKDKHGKKVLLKTIADVVFNLNSKDRSLRQST